MQAISSRLRFALLVLVISSITFGLPAGAIEDAATQAEPEPSVAADCKCETTKTPPPETAKAELMALLHYFLANSSKEEAHSKFWSEDLVYTSSNGTRFGKADIMAGFAADDSEAADEGPAVVYSGEDVNAQIFGTTAVITFRLVGTPDDGSAISEYFNTGTFVVQQGSWKAVAWQATIIPGAASQ